MSEKGDGIGWLGDENSQKKQKRGNYTDIPPDTRQDILKDALGLEDSKITGASQASEIYGGIKLFQGEEGRASHGDNR